MFSRFVAHEADISPNSLALRRTNLKEFSTQDGRSTGLVLPYETSVGVVGLDLVGLMPGDVVLSMLPAMTSRMIKFLQLYSNCQEKRQNARWSHVAIVGPDLRIWDITSKQPVKGHKPKDYFSSLSGGLAQVRRPIAQKFRDQFSVTFDTSDMQKTLDVLEGKPYWNFTAVAMQLQGMMKDLKEGELLPSLQESYASLQEEDFFVCSTFVERVLGDLLVVGGSVWQDVFCSHKLLMLPCDFASCPLFETVVLDAYQM